MWDLESGIRGVTTLTTWGMMAMADGQVELLLVEVVGFQKNPYEWRAFGYTGRDGHLQLN
jgi:hypothetical protein